MSWKEEILDELFKDVEEFYECRGTLHIGYDSIGKPGSWKAHPFCGKTLRGWIGFSEVQYSKTSNICPICLMMYAVIKGKKMSEDSLTRKRSVVLEHKTENGGSTPPPRIRAKETVIREILKKGSSVKGIIDDPCYAMNKQSDSLCPKGEP